MDIRVRDILSKTRMVKGAENSVLFGACVRDMYFHKEPKYFDLAVPHSAFKEVTKAYRDWDHFGYPSQGGKKHDGRSVYYEGIAVRMWDEDLPNDENFALSVVHTCTWGLNMLWSEDGKSVKTTEEFEKDRRNKTLTLYKLNHISELGKALENYREVNESLIGYQFACPHIKVEPVTITFSDEVHELEVEPPKDFVRWEPPRAARLGLDPVIRFNDAAAGVIAAAGLGAIGGQPVDVIAREAQQNGDLGPDGRPLRIGARRVNPFNFRDQVAIRVDGGELTWVSATPANIRFAEGQIQEQAEAAAAMLQPAPAPAPAEWILRDDEELGDIVREFLPDPEDDPDED